MSFNKKIFIIVFLKELRNLLGAQLTANTLTILLMLFAVEIWKFQTNNFVENFFVILSLKINFLNKFLVFVSNISYFHNFSLHRNC